MIDINVEAAMLRIHERWPHQHMSDEIAATWRSVLAMEPDPISAREAFEALAADRVGRPDPAEFRRECLAIRRRKCLAAVSVEPPGDAVPMPADFRERFLVRS